MRLLIQRVIEASVQVDGGIVGSCEGGFLVFVGITHGDTVKTIRAMAEKTIHLRIFEDEQHKMNCCILEKKGSILAVPQFTLYADASKGRRPNFIAAANPDVAIVLFEEYCKALREFDVKVETGIFGADMKVGLINDGPVTIWLDSNDFHING